MSIDVTAYLRAHADPRYRAFHQKIVPGIHNLIGVRTPDLRALAREILLSGENGIEKFLERGDFSSYESTLLFGFVTGGWKIPLARTKKYITRYVRRIDNWALCDGLCAALKVAAREPDAMWAFLARYARSRQEFPLRFAIVMFLSYYLHPTYIDAVMDIYARTRHPGYNVKMAVAWGVSVAFVKFRTPALTLLRAKTLDPWTHNKALQKIRESSRVTAADKLLTRELKVF